MPNRLARESSPYLRQHQENPVDWFPWGDAAFERARVEDKPIFLSIGYSSCHWCHVMAHESFESTEVAAILNDHFVSVKVDREERPDVDEAYMTAVQLATGRGGWPMTLFLTPDKRPFFAGTYLPKEDRGQTPGFLGLCLQIADLWRKERGEIERSAQEFAAALAETIGRQSPVTSAEFDDEFVANAVRSLASDFDPTYGGFGSAPKFPPHTAIDFLFRFAVRDSAPGDLRELAIGMALGTLRQMCIGGIRDHVGGGFHRYSTDDRWLLPHFEKMLYDNALMAGNLATAAALTAGTELQSLFVGAIAGILDWLGADMTSNDGLFYSAVDADSEGEEGKYYVWTDREIRSLLGESATSFMSTFGVESEGNFREEATGKLTGANVLHLTRATEEFRNELASLREDRGRRPRPGLDDKALVSWNGLTIAALASLGAAPAAEAAAEAILIAEADFGSLPHQIVRGRPMGVGYLDDFAAFALGLFSLAEFREILEANRQRFPDLPEQFLSAHSADEWKAHALRLVDEMVDLFWDEAGGGFFGTCGRHEILFGRSKPVFDSPIPSGNALAVRCLLQGGDTVRADRTLGALLGWMARAPQATEALISAGLSRVGQLSAQQIESQIDPFDVPEPRATEVEVRLENSKIEADGEGVGNGTVLIEIPEGLHINSNKPPARWLVPTEITFDPTSAVVTFPSATDDAYRGRVRVPFTMRLAPGQSGADFEVCVSYQACTDSECLQPTEKRLTGIITR